ncbi:MAG: hypothetical protein P8L91_09775 [Candidatus Marinimicrobia bacterium]|nr:hypothetical protein [Candidatus Neomarinimicrobiota bacterium]
MKVVIIFRYTVLLIPFFLIGQEIDTTIVKYFPTDLTRSILLQDGIDKKKIKKGAYFKATYDGSGDLIKIEYIPSKGDKGVLDTVQTRTLFYLEWNDYKRELSNPISEWDSERLPHYKATFGRKGRLTFVEKYDGLGEKLFTYKLRWNKEGTRSAYKVIFHKNMIITQLDSILFANPASEIRTNWVADFRSIKDGRPKSVSVYDELGSNYYSYKFYYDDLQDSINQTEKITSRYFQSDTSFLGRHEIYIAKEKFLTQLDYFNIDGSLISRNAYWMDPILEDVIVTTANEDGEIIGRHIVSKANVLWRQYQLGGTYKYDEEEEKVNIRERKVVKDRIIEEEEEKDVAMMNLDIYGSLPMINGVGLNMKQIEWGPGFIVGSKLPWIFRFDQSLYYLLFEYMSVSLPGGYYPLELNGFNALVSTPISLSSIQGINIVGGFGMHLASYGQVNNINSFAIIGGAEFRLVSNVFSNSRIKNVFGFRAVHSMADPRDEEANNNFILFHVGFIYSF